MCASPSLENSCYGTNLHFKNNAASKDFREFQRHGIIDSEKAGISSLIRFGAMKVDAIQNLDAVLGKIKYELYQKQMHPYIYTGMKTNRV